MLALQVYIAASEVLRDENVKQREILVSDSITRTGVTLITSSVDVLVHVITGGTMSLETTVTVQFILYNSPGSALPSVTICTTGFGVATRGKKD